MRSDFPMLWPNWDVSLRETPPGGPLPLMMPRVAQSLDTPAADETSSDVAEVMRVSKASSRINVAEDDLSLPHASIHLACTKGTYVRAFARDLGETLGSGAFLNSLQRSRSGVFCVEKSLTVDQALELLAR